MKKKFKDPLRIIDATVISLCLARFNWAKYRKAKGAVKLHLNLDGDRCIPFDAYVTNGKVHESKEMKNLTRGTGVIYAMDRGYIEIQREIVAEIEAEKKAIDGCRELIAIHEKKIKAVIERVWGKDSDEA